MRVCRTAVFKSHFWMKWQMMVTYSPWWELSMSLQQQPPHQQVANQPSVLPRCCCTSFSFKVCQLSSDMMLGVVQGFHRNWNHLLVSCRTLHMFLHSVKGFRQNKHSYAANYGLFRSNKKQLSAASSIWMTTCCMQVMSKTSTHWATSPGSTAITPECHLG